MCYVLISVQDGGDSPCTDLHPSPLWPESFPKSLKGFSPLTHGTQAEVDHIHTFSPQLFNLVNRLDVPTLVRALSIHKCFGYLCLHFIWIVGCLHFIWIVGFTRRARAATTSTFVIQSLQVPLVGLPHVLRDLLGPFVEVLRCSLFYSSAIKDSHPQLPVFRPARWTTR